MKKKVLWMKNMGRKEDSNGYSREVSNNILVLILIVIIFVSVLGTMIVKQTIDTMSVRSHHNNPQPHAWVILA